MASKPRTPDRKIRYGEEVKPLKPRYEFNKLQKPGQFFLVTGDMGSWGSLRTQASKQGAKRGIRFSVGRIDDVKAWLEKNQKDGNVTGISPANFTSKTPGVVVRLDYYNSP